MKIEIVVLILSFILLFQVINIIVTHEIKQDKILFPTDADTGE